MNALIQPYVAGVQARVVCPLYDPFQERENRARFGRATVLDLEQANSMVVYSGRQAACGQVLVRRGDYIKLNPYYTDLKLQMEDFASTSHVSTLGNLTVVQARCISRGRASDPDSIYLVELTDRKGILSNQWFQYPTNSQYNMVAPAYPGGYYSQTLNSGTPWTWTGMIGDLWGQMASFLGGYPGLPVTPVQDVEGYCFPGVSCWDAINNMVDSLGCSIASNLASAVPYFIVDLAASDAVFAAQQVLYAPLLADDMEDLDAGGGRVPAEVVVYFHRRNQYYGTEETIRQGALQWSTTPAYAVTVSAPAQFTGASGKHSIWVEATVRYDVDGVPLPADVTAAAAIASERVQQYYAMIFRGTLGTMHQTYNGVLPFATGSQVDVVRWRMKRVADDGLERLGWMTEIMRGYE